MSKGRGGQGQWQEKEKEELRVRRKCCAYLSDTDTHINGTDCAAPIAPRAT